LFPFAVRVLAGENLGDPFQDDDRNDSLCLLRVVAKSREHIAMRLVETIALDSLRNRRCAHLKLLRAHLNLGLAMLHQIMVPAGMRRRAALRRRDDVALTITVVDERRCAQLAAFGPARRKEQEVVAKRSDAFSALRVKLVYNPSVPIRHILGNALEDCAIPLPAGERSASGLTTTHYCPRSNNELQRNLSLAVRGVGATQQISRVAADDPLGA